MIKSKIHYYMSLLGIALVLPLASLSASGIQQINDNIESRYSDDALIDSDGELSAKRCRNCCRCRRRGPTGPQGPQGPQGPAGTVALAYLSKYSTTTEFSSPSSLVPFDQQTVDPSGIIDNGDSTFTIQTTGVYVVSFGIYGNVQSGSLSFATQFFLMNGVTPSRPQITFNNSLVQEVDVIIEPPFEPPVTAFAVVDYPAQFETASAILKLTAGDVLSVVNQGPQSFQFGAAPVPMIAQTTFITIERIQ